MKPALLAEDDPASRVFLSEALHLLGWQCEAFETAAAAAEAAIARRFDVLLLDFNLPDGNGLQCLREIRNQDSHASADATALALTAADDPQLHARLRQAGFDAVATKPLSIQQLGQALGALGLHSTSTGSDTSTVASAALDTDAHHSNHRLEMLPIWDDAAALTTVGGNAAILANLRELMRRDLPEQRDRILANPHGLDARQHLHRLRAACGFCGAAQLAAAVAWLEAALAHSPDSPHPDTAMAISELARSIVRILATAPDQGSN